VQAQDDVPHDGARRHVQYLMPGWHQGKVHARGWDPERPSSAQRRQGVSSYLGRVPRNVAAPHRPPQEERRDDHGSQNGLIQENLRPKRCERLGRHRERPSRKPPRQLNVPVVLRRSVEEKVIHRLLERSRKVVRIVIRRDLSALGRLLHLCARVLLRPRSNHRLASLRHRVPHAPERGAYQRVLQQRFRRQGLHRASTRGRSRAHRSSATVRVRPTVSPERDAVEESATRDPARHPARPAPAPVQRGEFFSIDPSAREGVRRRRRRRGRRTIASRPSDA
ncbi:hypothetical protein BE221DRAFT_62624, partial [Ostreococcus tauri]